MVIKDLKTTCPNCRGSGRQAGVAQWGIAQINPAGRCLVCGGLGFRLTPLGEELVALLRPFIEEIVEARLKAAREAAGRPSGEGTP